MDLCLSNTSNTRYALHTLVYHPNYMCFIKKKFRLQLQYVIEFFCKIYHLSANTMYKL